MSATLKVEEQMYLDVLKSMKERVNSLFKPENKESCNNVIKEVVDYFGLICDYHDVQMLPDLSASQDIQDGINCFTKHKELFYLYEDVFRYEPYVILYSKKYSENPAEFFKNMSNHLEKYVNFLKSLTSNKQIEEVLNTVKNALKEHVDYEDIKYVIAEIITSEETYIKDLETIINDIYPRLENTKYAVEKKRITGKSKEICENQKLFYEDLLNCIYDSDITDIMDCFLKHEQHFRVYSEDIALKGSSNLTNSFRKSCQVPPKIDFDLTRLRLTHYKMYLEKARAKTLTSDKQAVIKIKRVEKMVGEILTTANDSINDIFGANIYLETLGSLIMRVFVHIKPLTLDSEGYSGAVYLYEKALVITKRITQESSNNQIVNSYEGHIITTKLGYNYQEKQKILQVYFQEKLEKKYFYNLSSDEEENLVQLEKTLKRLLLVQVDETKKMLETL